MHCSSPAVHPFARAIASPLLLALALLLAAESHAQVPRKMFVTSAAHKGNLAAWPEAVGTGLAAADAICQQLATDAGLTQPELYVALLSDASDDAYCRLQGLTGTRESDCNGTPEPLPGAGPWVRIDGLPFGPALDDLFASQGAVYYPADLTEFGVRSTSSEVWSGTNGQGAFVSEGINCSGWSSDLNATETWIGFTTSTTGTWIDGATRECDVDRPLYCFQKGTGGPLPYFRSFGRLAFVTSVAGKGNLGGWAQAGGNTGLAAGDAICRQLAADANLPEPQSFVAWLSTDSVQARNRIVNDGRWVRLDGVRIANNKAELNGGRLQGSINLTETGVYRVPNAVWTGTAVNGVYEGSGDCADWTATTAGSFAQYGLANSIDGSWTSYSHQSDCSVLDARLYCFQDLPDTFLFLEDFESGGFGGFTATP